MWRKYGEKKYTEKERSVDLAFLNGEQNQRLFCKKVEKNKRKQRFNEYPSSIHQDLLKSIKEPDVLNEWGEIRATSHIHTLRSTHPSLSPPLYLIIQA